MFKLLVQQVADTLSEEIAKQTWTGVLPSERALAQRLQVSRKTIRGAMATLRKNGTLRTLGRRHTEVVRNPKGSAKKKIPRVGMLLPIALVHARPFTMLWINQLAASLQENGFAFELVQNRNHPKVAAAKAMESLVRSTPKDCWILARSTLQMQTWFEETETPVVIAGSPHRKAGLPCVDLDYRATCRHAAGEMLRRGHQQLAFLYEDAGLAGDRESVEGFVSGCIASSTGVSTPLVAAVEPEPGAIIKTLRRWLRLPSAPSALLVTSPQLYLTVSSYCGSVGIRVPTDLSLVCRDEEPFFRAMIPPPAYYHCAPDKFAAAMHHSVVEVVRNRNVPNTLLIPDFVPGVSLGDFSPHARYAGSESWARDQKNRFCSQTQA